MLSVTLVGQVLQRSKQLRFDFNWYLVDRAHVEKISLDPKPSPKEGLQRVVGQQLTCFRCLNVFNAGLAPSMARNFTNSHARHKTRRAQPDGRRIGAIVARSREPLPRLQRKCLRGFFQLQLKGMLLIFRIIHTIRGFKRGCAAIGGAA